MYEGTPIAPSGELVRKGLKLSVNLASGRDSMTRELREDDGVVVVLAGVALGEVVAVVAVFAAVGGVAVLREEVPEAAW